LGGFTAAPEDDARQEAVSAQPAHVVLAGFLAQQRFHRDFFSHRCLSVNL
jgi:hypothetical protein